MISTQPSFYLIIEVVIRGTYYVTHDICLPARLLRAADEEQALECAGSLDEDLLGKMTATCQWFGQERSQQTEESHRPKQNATPVSGPLAYSCFSQESLKKQRGVNGRFGLQQSDIDSNAKPCKAPFAIRNSFGNLRGGQICVGCKSHHRWASIISTKQRVCPCRSLMPSCGFLCCTLVDSHGNKKGQVHGSSRTTFTKLYLFILICGSKTVLISSSSSKMLPRTANKSSAN